MSISQWWRSALRTREVSSYPPEAMPVDFSNLDEAWKEAVKLLAEKRFKQAETLFQNISRLVPGHMLTLSHLAEAKEGQQDWAAATKLLRRLRPLLTDPWSADLSMIRIDIKRGKQAKALKRLFKVMSQNEGSRFFAQILLQMSAVISNFPAPYQQEAITAFRAMVIVSDKKMGISTSGLRILARIALIEGNTTEALKLLIEAHRMRPKDESIRRELERINVE